MKMDDEDDEDPSHNSPPPPTPKKHHVFIFYCVEPKNDFPEGCTRIQVPLFFRFLTEENQFRFLPITCCGAGPPSPDGCFVCRWHHQTKMPRSAPTYLPRWTSWWLWSIPFLVSDDIRENKQTNVPHSRHTVKAFFLFSLRL